MHTEHLLCARKDVENLFYVINDHVLFTGHLQQPIMGRLMSGKELSEKKGGAGEGGQSPPCSTILSLCAGLPVFINFIEETP